VAVIQFNTDDGTATTKRSAVRPAIEAVGNFVLVFVFGVAITTHSWFAPLLIGAPLIVMVYFRNRLPAAYFNPSLTFAVLMRHRIAIRDALALLLIQSGSGLLAAMVVCAMVGPGHLAVTAAKVNGSILIAVFALELIFTSSLCYVTFDVSRSDRHTAGDYNSWPIALGVVASIIAIGATITDDMVPKVSFDDTVLGILSWPTVWIYIVSQLLSGIVSTITFVNLAEQR
jgi:aquaporin Z